MNEASDDYRRALAESTQHHEGSKTFSGKFLRPHKPFIQDVIEQFGCTSILDYGCGKGEQYRWIDPADGKTLEQAWGIEVVKHDPAYAPYAAEPTGTFDLVICTHTLGSVPVRDLGWIVDRLYGFANKAVYIAEKIGQPKKKVFSRPELMPIGWTPEQWLKALDRPHAVEVIFTARERTDAGAIMRRWIAGCGSGFSAAVTIMLPYVEPATQVMA
jgi:hypothetical protein